MGPCVYLLGIFVSSSRFVRRFWILAPLVFFQVLSAMIMALELFVFLWTRKVLMRWPFNIDNWIHRLKHGTDREQSLSKSAAPFIVAFSGATRDGWWLREIQSPYLLNFCDENLLGSRNDIVDPTASFAFGFSCISVFPWWITRSLSSSNF